MNYREGQVSVPLQVARNSTEHREACGIEAQDRKWLPKQAHHLECDQPVQQEISVTTAKTNQ